jgi:hypothetical protein
MHIEERCWKKDLYKVSATIRNYLEVMINDEEAIWN